MVDYSKLITTKLGQQLNAKVIAGQDVIKFTKIEMSSTEYTITELENLTALSNVKQSSLVSKVSRLNGVSVQVDAAFTNAELSEGYYMRTIGLYATDPDLGGILYAVAIAAGDNCYMPGYNGTAVSAVCVQLVQTIANADNVSLEVNSGAYATVADIAEFRGHTIEITNIKSLLVDNACTNLFDYKGWVKNGGALNVWHGTGVVENNGITLTAGATDCYTTGYARNQYDGTDWIKPFLIPVEDGETYTLSWDTDDTVVGRVFIYFVNPTVSSVGNIRVALATDKHLTFTAIGFSHITVRFGVNDKNKTIHYKNIRLNHGDKTLDYEDYYKTNKSLSKVSDAHTALMTDNACKNLINPLYSAGYTTTKNGLTFTVNNNGSITVNGTATGVEIFAIGNYQTIKANTFYTLTGCPSGGADNSYRLDVRRKSDNNVVADSIDIGEGTTFIVKEDTEVYVTIRIDYGITLDNVTFYPMLRYAEVIDDTYEQYYPNIKNVYSEVSNIIKSYIPSLQSQINTNKNDISYFTPEEVPSGFDCDDWNTWGGYQRTFILYGDESNFKNAPSYTSSLSFKHATVIILPEDIDRMQYKMFFIFSDGTIFTRIKGLDQSTDWKGFNDTISNLKGSISTINTSVSNLNTSLSNLETNKVWWTDYCHQITTKTDLNNFTNRGIYWFYGDLLTNAPSDYSSASIPGTPHILINLYTAKSVGQWGQYLITRNGIYHRYYASAYGFSSWFNTSKHQVSYTKPASPLNVLGAGGYWVDPLTGMCYVSMTLFSQYNTIALNSNIVTGLPVPSTGEVARIYGKLDTGSSASDVMFTLNSSGNLIFTRGSVPNNSTYWVVRFFYPTTL